MGVLSLIAGGALALVCWQRSQLEQLRRAGAHAAGGVTRHLSVYRTEVPRVIGAPRPAPPPAPRGARQEDAAPPRFPAEDAAGAPHRPATWLDDPDFLHAWGVYREGMLDARYAGLFRQLNLAPGELAAFKRLLAEKDNVALDVVAINQAAPVPPEVMRRGVQAAQADVEDSIRAELGNDRYEAYRNYEDTLAQRATVAQLERRLSYSSTPLTGGQADAMVKVLAQNPSGQSTTSVSAVALVVGAGPGGLLPVMDGDSGGLISDQAIVQAQGVLSAQQLAALREIQAEQLAAAAAGQLILDGSAGGPATKINWALLLQ